MKPVAWIYCLVILLGLLLCSLAVCAMVFE